MKNILEIELYKNDLNRVLLNFKFKKLNNSSLLITGGLGLIGSAVVDLIHYANLEYKLNCRIFIADINENFYKERYGNCHDITYIKYDAIKAINFQTKFDYIIHGAGLASPELYISNPVETILSNFNGALNLLNYALENKVKRFLYISSSEVYGSKNSIEAFKEDTFGLVNIQDLRCSYAEAKRASEILCHSFFAEYGVETIIVRPGHIYGPTASPKDQRISSAFAYLAAKGENLTMKSSGLQKRSYCYSIDCAVAILFALLEGKPGEAYNIGANSTISIKEMAEILAKAGNVQLIVQLPTEKELKCFNPMNNSSLNNDKIKAIGYQDTFTIDEGLNHTVTILKELIN